MAPDRLIRFVPGHPCRPHATGKDSTAAEKCVKPSLLSVYGRLRNDTDLYGLFGQQIAQSARSLRLQGNVAKLPRMILQIS